MNTDFQAIIGSGVDLEELYVELQYQGEPLLTITQEEGYDSLDVEVWPRADGNKWRFKLNDLLEAIDFAKKRLSEFRIS